MEISYSKSFLLEAYEKMLRIRKFELRAISCSLNGQTFGNIHSSAYQEACAVGAVMAIGEKDYLVTSHRGHGHTIAKGADTRSMMAELFGKETGCCRGKGGSLHVADVSKGVLGANGIVGAGIPIGTGSALASKIRGTDEVTLVFFGDGASNEGAFHESVNMAAAWKLPAVFVCENNRWGISVRIQDVTNTPHIADRAAGYGIPGVSVDGNNVLEVYEAVKDAVDRARAGEGPSLVELNTYRVLGHNVGDPMKYKTEKEIEETEYWKTERDAILLHKKYMLENGVPAEDIEQIDRRIEEEIEDAVKFAADSEYPDKSEIYTDVYSTDNERCVLR